LEAGQVSASGTAVQLGWFTSAVILSWKAPVGYWRGVSTGISWNPEHLGCRIEIWLKGTLSNSAMVCGLWSHMSTDHIARSFDPATEKRQISCLYESFDVQRM